MTQLLTCPTCSGVFEIPPEYTSAPLIQCPFCGGMTPNASAALASPLANQAHSFQRAHENTQEVDDLAATAAYIRPVRTANTGAANTGTANTGAAKTGTALPAPSFQITGLVVSETRKIDPSQRKRRKHPDEVDDDELVPEEDPTIAMLAPPPMEMAPYPYALDGSPLPSLPLSLPRPLPEPASRQVSYPQPHQQRQSPQAMNPPTPVIPLGGGRARPTPQPRPNQPLAPLEGELPDDEDLPRSRSKGAIFAVVVLLLADIVVFGVALGNNGIFHFGDVGGSFSAALGSATPMEIKPPPLPAPPEVPELITLGNDQDRPDLRLLLSSPTVVSALNGDKILVVYGQATNRAREALEEVMIEGAIHDLQGTVVAKSLVCPLLPLYAKDASVKGLAARDALKVVSNAMGRDSLLRIWGERTMADPADLRVDSGEVAGFLLIFPEVSTPLTDQHLVEVSVQQARRVLSP